MSMQTGSAAALQPVEKSAAVSRRQSGANGDSTESGAPTFASVLTSVEPESNADLSAAATADDGTRDAAPSAPADVPLDPVALLAQNPNRTAQLADLGAAVLADSRQRAAAPWEMAALSGPDGQPGGQSVGGPASHRLGVAPGKALAVAAGGKATAAATATDLAANTGAAQSVAAQHASSTQALLRRADVDRVSQETEQLSLGKGPQGQANEARLTADAASADGRVTLAGQAGTLPGASTLDALGTFSRMAANPRGGDRPAARTPFVPAGSALAGSWSDHAMPSGSPATLTTYAPDATVAVPDAAVAEKLNYWISRGVQNAELQLDAFGGGTVKVSISVQGQHAQVDFRSDQPEARKLLLDAMPQLSAMLKSEGLLLSGGFVGSQAQQHPGAQQRPSRPDNMRSAIIGVVTPSAERPPALSRTPGRAVDLFV
jgi:flagellar hook-length control protein FliK